MGQEWVEPAWTRLLVPIYDVLHPGQVVTHLGVDTRFIGPPTDWWAPGHNALKDPATRKGTSGVAL